ncbi:Ankyrin repeats (3 copies) [Symmachiella macrocystis]|uniref:Ankyrin repeats (3 copies) n=1 Tax=Symmachiella macrocystis TaxID=2527985 RepID=A0A5C6BB88_9PLAN|nr:ankyrin repeat domain-containing protein [Symmachiella macrocystis]TWU08987.1 Ankyrin repeats (3 copies) [Symmachiella macrocystis]
MLAAVPLLLVGCEKATESVSDTTAGPLNDSNQAVEEKAFAHETHAAPSAKEEIKKVTFEVPAFLDAALHGKIDTVQRAIESGMDVNTTDEQQRTALMFAAFNGHTPLVKLLLEQGASVGERDETGRTALMFAATGANAEAVELLIEAGAEVNAADTGEGFTALMHAAAEGQIKVVQVLLKHKADPAIRDTDGDTARDFAKKNGHAEVVQLLEK